MKILHCVHGFPPEFEGGTELYLLGLVRSLAAMGHDSVVLAGSGETSREDAIERETHDGVTVLRLRRSGNFHEEWSESYAPAVERLVDGVLREERPDIVHVHHWQRLTRNLVDRARRAGVPAVVTFHDLWSTCGREFRLRDGAYCDVRVLETDCEHCVRRFGWQGDHEIKRLLAAYRDDLAEELRLAAVLTAPTAAHARRVEFLHGLPRGRVRPVTLGAIRTLSPVTGNDPGSGRFPDGPLRIGHWAHMNHVKGSHLVLEAAALIGEPERFELHLYGPFVTPSYEARMRALAVDLPVTFHGAFGPADLERARLDLAVVPSVTPESFSYVIDEAFDLGLPALVSDLGALPERVGEAGAAFEAGSPGSLAARLREVLDSPERLDAYRGAIEGRRTAATSTMESHAAEVARMYDEARAARMQGEPRDESEVLRERAELAAWQLEDRSVSLLDLEARAQYLTADSWSARSELGSARAAIERLAAEIDSRRPDSQKESRS